jgi:hypothetical protein
MYNSINSIKLEYGSFLENRKDIGRHFINYFKNLLATSNPILNKGKLPFTPINYNALVLSPYELSIVQLCLHELPFCAQKPFPSVKATNSNGQSDNTL